MLHRITVFLCRQYIEAQFELFFDHFINDIARGIRLNRFIADTIDHFTLRVKYIVKLQ